MSVDTEAQALITRAGEVVASFRSYRCVVLNTDCMNGVVRPTERIESYFLKPGSIYLRFLAGKYEGLQASYVPERDKPGHFMARETGLKGLVGPLSLSEDATLVRTLYPHHFSVRETSIPLMVELIRSSREAAARLGKLAIDSLREVDEPLLGGRATHVVTRLSDDPRDGLRWPACEVWVCHRTELPLRIKFQAFGGGLFGDYAFTEFALDAKVDPKIFALPR